MYEMVDTEIKQQEFNRIRRECRKENQSIITKTDSKQFLIYADNKAAGILEFIPFSAEVNQIFPFTNFDQVKKNSESVYEIKIDILKEYRGFRGKDVLPDIVSAIIKFFEQNNVSSFVGFIEPPLHFVLKTIFRLPIDKLGNKLKYNGEDVLPICLVGLKKSSGK